MLEIYTSLIMEPDNIDNKEITRQDIHRLELLPFNLFSILTLNLSHVSILTCCILIVMFYFCVLVIFGESRDVMVR